MMAAAPTDREPAAGATPAGAGAERQALEFIDLLAYIYLQHARPDKAAVLLRARDLLAPGEPRTLLGLALAQLRSAKPAQALQTLERLAILGAMGAEFHLVRAQALQALDKPDEAASAMRAHLAMLAIPVRSALPHPA